MFVRKNLALVAALFLAFCLNTAAGEPRTAKDMRGNVVELPEKVSKVASLCNENNQ
ncbi:MAG: peptide ABC transporter substrate-binding protein, partial [Campylobacter sp.]|nr:peptide ABC transporter substrate-binding protein [Campylobacter sp.]